MGRFSVHPQLCKHFQKRTIRVQLIRIPLPHSFFRRNLCVQGCLFLVLGRVADLYGRKKVFCLGSVWMAAFTLACGFAKGEHGPLLECEVPTIILHNRWYHIEYPSGYARNWGSCYHSCIGANSEKSSELAMQLRIFLIGGHTGEYLSTI